MRKLRGFTLIELLIALAILGLLAAVAIPAYRKSTQKANRSDAKISLSRLANLEERFYFRENNYTVNFTDIISGLTGTVTTVASDSAYYSIVVSLPSGSTAGTAWKLTATAVGGQLLDTDCRTFTLTSVGAKTATTSTGAATTSCW